MFKLFAIILLVAVSAFAVAPTDGIRTLRSDDTGSAFSRVGNATALTEDLVTNSPC